MVNQAKSSFQDAEGVHLRIKSLFFNLHDVMKTVGRSKIP